MNTSRTGISIPSVVLCCILLGCALFFAQARTVETAAAQWECRVIPRAEMLQELSAKATPVKRPGADLAADRNSGVQAGELLAVRFNELGGEGWHFAGYCGEHGENFVFHRAQ